MSQIADYVTIGRRHNQSHWEVILSPAHTREEHKQLFKTTRFRTKHRVYAETWLCGNDGILKKTFNRDTGEDIDSSSSGSSSSSTAASVTSSSSSSSTAALDTSSSSSSSSSSNTSSSSSS